MFLAPRSVAVIGASDDPTRIGGRTVANLLRGGFPGAIHPINPKRPLVQGLPAYPSIEAVPTSVDCAVIALPGELVLPEVEACARKGVKGLVIFSAGFNEAGAEGRIRQERLREIVDQTGMRVIGPNCLGLYHVGNGAWLSFTTQFQERVEGPTIGIVSQSGGSAAHILRLAQRRGLAIGTFITTGNEADVEFGDGLRALAADDDTAVIVAYIEGLRSAGNVTEGLRAARAAGKPVILLKVGRTAAGAQAAASHTASLAGEDRIYDAIFRAHGVYRAFSTEELLDVAYAALATKGRQVAGSRLGVVTISGGMGAQIADSAAELGLSLPDVSADGIARLKALCPPGSPHNPVDITAQLSTDPHLLAASLRVLLEEGEHDLLLAFYGVYADMPTLNAVFLEDLKALRGEFTGPPIALCVICPPEVAAAYTEAGFLVFEEPARAVRALAALRSFGGSSEGAMIQASGETVSAGERFNEAEAKALLMRAGIRLPIERIAATAEEVAAAARGMRFPLVLKIVSADILHKTDVGGVVLGIADERALGVAAARMRDAVAAAAPDARIEGFLLSEMVPGGVELIVGTRRDALFGPIVMAGLGGVTAELFHDVALRPAPVDEAGALEMLRELRSFPLLDGYRGAPRMDIPAVAKAVAAISALAAANADSIDTIEVNPLRALADGAVALDAVIETVAAAGDASVLAAAAE